MILVTPGDPAGIGPEVIRKALADPALDRSIEFRCIGNFEPNTRPEESAKAALAALEEAASLLVSGKAEGVVTGPICKHRMRDAGFRFPGQTEFFASRAGVEDFAMLLTGGEITVALATAHVPLSAVAGLLTGGQIVRVGALLADFVADRGVERPRIAVAGLNPHAGEAGMLGREEVEVIAPAVEELAERFGDTAFFEGPLPPDTLFFRLARGDWDAALVMYHDQGLIPLKLHAFETGVNVTLGLPFVRTSPDHGTAFDIAGRGVAQHGSMLAALNLATDLVLSRRIRER